MTLHFNPAQIKSHRAFGRDFLSQLDYTQAELAVMQDLIDSVPLLVMAAYDKGVRFEVADVSDDGGTVSYQDSAFVFRGRIGKFVFDLCQSFIAGLSRQPV